MAPRKKQPPKFDGALAEPIVIDLELPPPGVEDWKPKGDFGFIEQMEKLVLLTKYYNIEKSGDWLKLAYKLAVDFVPGFEVIYDDPLAAAMGLPVRAKAVRSGKGAAPEFWGPRLLSIVEVMKKLGKGQMFVTDRQCAEFLFENAWPQPDKRPTAAERAAGVATVERRIREARRRRDGPAKVVRGSSKLH